MRTFHWLALTIVVFLLSARLQAAEVADPDPGRFAASIERFEKQDSEAPPQPGGILFVGSSSIRMWKLDRCFPELNALNRGFGGSHISDVNHYAERIVWKYKPSQVVFYCGENDLWHGKSPERVAADFRTFCKGLFAQAPEAKLWLLPCKPSPVRQRVIDQVRAANELLRKQAEADDRIVYLGAAFDLLMDDQGGYREELFLKDRLHLNDDGYRLWTRMLAPHLTGKPVAGGAE